MKLKKGIKKKGKKRRLTSSLDSAGADRRGLCAEGATGSRNVEGQVGVGGVGGCESLGGGLAVAEKSDGQVFDVSGPLGGQLEELNVVPLHAVYGHWRDMRHTSSAE